MIRIEVTGDSIPEVADKLLAIGGRLRANDLQTASLSQAEVIDYRGPTEAAKPKATRKAKEVEPAADPEPSGSGATAAQPESVSEGSPATAAGAEPEASSTTLDYDSDVFPVVIDTVGKIGRDGVVAILEQFGVSNAKHLAPERWAELVETLRGAQ